MAKANFKKKKCGSCFSTARVSVFHQGLEIRTAATQSREAFFLLRVQNISFDIAAWGIGLLFQMKNRGEIRKKMGCLCKLLMNSWGVHNIEDSISLANFDSKQLKTKGGIDVGAGGIKVDA